jgi:hypothetical protein
MNTSVGRAAQMDIIQLGAYTVSTMWYINTFDLIHWRKQQLTYETCFSCSVKASAGNQLAQVYGPLHQVSGK